MLQRQHEEREADGKAENGSDDDGASRHEGSSISGSPTQHSGASVLCGADVRHCWGAAASAAEAPQPAQSLFRVGEGEHSRDEEDLERVHPHDWEQCERRKDHHREGTAAYDEESEKDSDCQPFSAEPDKADAVTLLELGHVHQELRIVEEVLKPDYGPAGGEHHDRRNRGDDGSAIAPREDQPQPQGPEKDLHDGGRRYRYPTEVRAVTPTPGEGTAEDEKRHDAPNLRARPDRRQQ